MFIFFFVVHFIVVSFFDGVVLSGTLSVLGGSMHHFGIPMYVGFPALRRPAHHGSVDCLVRFYGTDARREFS